MAGQPRDVLRMRRLVSMIIYGRHTGTVGIRWCRAAACQYCSVKLFYGVFRNGYILMAAGIQLIRLL